MADARCNEPLTRSCCRHAHNVRRRRPENRAATRIARKVVHSTLDARLRSSFHQLVTMCLCADATSCRIWRTRMRKTAWFATERSCVAARARSSPHACALLAAIGVQIKLTRIAARTGASGWVCRARQIDARDRQRTRITAPVRVTLLHCDSTPGWAPAASSAGRNPAGGACRNRHRHRGRRPARPADRSPCRP